MNSKVKKRKVGFFMLPLLTQGAGAEKYFIEAAKNLASQGISSDIITLNEKSFRTFARIVHVLTHGNFFGKIDISGRESEANVAKRLGKAKWRKTSWKNLGAVLSDYDVIYSKNELVDLFALKKIGYKKLPPVVVGVHTPIYYPIANTVLSRLHNLLYLGYPYKFLLGGVSCIHLSNKSTKELVDRRFKINSSLIYYPFSSKSVLASSKEHCYKKEFPKNKINIIFVSRLADQKGIDILGRIIDNLAKDKITTSKIRVNIFGSGDERNEKIVKTLARKYSFVKYFGHVENKLIPNILSKQNLFFTTAKWETLPFNVLESQAVGLPGIAFNIPGPNDIIVNGKTGILVEPSNEKEFLRAIKDFIFGKRLFNRKEIIDHLDQKFNPKKIYSELVTLFDNTIRIYNEKK